ncbi:MAG: invasion associated locus B family protein [Pseudomonadota bacterium]
MFNALKSGTILAACLLAAQAIAQEAEQPAPATDGLSLGETVVEGRIVGQEYLKETYDDWEVKCIATEDGNDPCQIYQLLFDGDGNSVAEISMAQLQGQGQAVAGGNIVTPLGTLLTEQITLQIDSGNPRRYPFTFCTQVGCVSRVGFTADDIASMKRGAEGRITIAPAGANGQKVALPMSLTGFTAAYDSLAAN